MFNKKDDHLNLALKFHKDLDKTDFDNIDFIHHVFTSVPVEKADISTSFAGFNFESPFYINGMTGGTGKAREYNKQIAILARETNTFMATGSLSVGLSTPERIDTFSIVRDLNPNGIIFANLGADKTLEDAKRATDILKADGIQIHVNATQELAMPEGDRDFSSWINNIQNIVDHVGVPVVVKEVGNGMSSKAIETLESIGVKTIDIAGKNGTDFGRIENFRRQKDKYDFLEDFGNSTAFSLLEAKDYIDKVEILASGGIRNSLDIVKALALGAKSVGMATRFLDLIDKGRINKAIEEVENWKYQIKTLLSLLDSSSIEELRNTDIIIWGKLAEFAKVRNIDIREYSNRKK